MAVGVALVSLAALLVCLLALLPGPVRDGRGSVVAAQRTTPARAQPTASTGSTTASASQTIASGRPTSVVSGTASAAHGGSVPAVMPGTPGRIEGTVLGASGRPVAGAYLDQRHGNQTDYTRSADAAGHFDFSCYGQPGGALFASSPQKGQLDLGQPDGGQVAENYSCGTSIVLRLPEAGSIDGNAGCSTQFPPRGVTVRLVSGASGLLASFDETYGGPVGPQGQMSVVGLSPGTYDLWNDPVVYHGTATVRAGHVTTVTFGTNDCTAGASPSPTTAATVTPSSPPATTASPAPSPSDT